MEQACITTKIQEGSADRIWPLALLNYICSKYTIAITAFWRLSVCSVNENPLLHLWSKSDRGVHFLDHLIG